MFIIISTLKTETAKLKFVGLHMKHINCFTVNVKNIFIIV